MGEKVGKALVGEELGREDSSSLGSELATVGWSDESDGLSEGLLLGATDGWLDKDGVEDGALLGGSLSNRITCKSSTEPDPGLPGGKLGSIAPAN